MNLPIRGVAALMSALVMLVSLTSVAQTGQSLTTDKDKVSYMIGMDVAKSLAPAAPDLDLTAFERALRSTLDGGKSPLADEETKRIGQALGQRIAARSGQGLPGMAPGTVPPAVDKEKAGLLVGADVGRSLTSIKEEIALPVFMQALHIALDNGTPLLDSASASAVRQAFTQRVQAQTQARNARLSETNAVAGRELLARNRQVKGVFTTPSGLQYTVVKQGSGRRPLPSDRVRVNYRGTLIDGTVFDSSYDRGQPAEFSLGQVIAGWTEGLALMPSGSTFRFWIPSDLGYGAKGNPSIGPNSTLIFDVELLDVL